MTREEITERAKELERDSGAAVVVGDSSGFIYGQEALGALLAENWAWLGNAVARSILVADANGRVEFGLEALFAIARTDRGREALRKLIRICEAEDSKRRYPF